MFSTRIREDLPLQRKPHIRRRGGTIFRGIDRPKLAKVRKSGNVRLIGGCSAERKTGVAGSKSVMAAVRPRAVLHSVVPLGTI